ncbi:MAG: TetR family transcriptional regulator [Chryseolinea sp.]
MTSERILSAAQKLFEEKGFDQTSVRDIATSANVNVALINYHFQSKENLLFTVLTNSMDTTRMKLSDINKLEESSDEKLKRVVALYVSKIFDNRHYYHFVQRELANSGRQEFRDALIKVINRNSLEFRQLLEDGQKSKEFRKDADLELAMATLFGILHQTTNEVLSKRYRRAGEKDDAFRKRVEHFAYNLLLQHLKK